MEMIEEGLKLKRHRENYFLMRREYEDGYRVDKYFIDWVDRDAMARKLSRAGREFIIKNLVLLCPGFVDVFKRVECEKNTKKQNALLLGILEEHIDNLASLIDFDEVARVKADEVYLECENLEKEIKLYRPIQDEAYLTKRQKKLKELSSFDVEEWLSVEIKKLRSQLREIVETVKPFYIVKGEAARKQEQRNRDLFFVLILQGLSCFYDFYAPDSFLYYKGYYSAIDVLALRASVLDKVPLSDFHYSDDLDGFYACLFDFDKRCGLFEYLGEPLDDLDNLGVKFNFYSWLEG